MEHTSNQGMGHLAAVNGFSLHEEPVANGLVYDDFLEYEESSEPAGPLRPLRFATHQAAMAWRNQQRMIQEPVVDETIPGTVAERQECVRQLYDAFVSLEEAEDNPNVISTFRNNTNDEDRIEVICWILLEATIQRRRSGPLLFAWNPGKAVTNQPQYPDFRTRFQRIVEALRFSKTICNHIYGPHFILTFVDDPGAAKKRKDQNRRLNSHKGELIRQAREAQKQEDAKPPVTRQRKRRKTAAQEEEEDTKFDGLSLRAQQGTPSIHNPNPLFTLATPQSPPAPFPPSARDPHHAHPSHPHSLATPTPYSNPYFQGLTYHSDIYSTTSGTPHGAGYPGMPFGFPDPSAAQSHLAGHMVGPGHWSSRPHVPPRENGACPALGEESEEGNGQAPRASGLHDMLSHPDPIGEGYLAGAWAEDIPALPSLEGGDDIFDW